MEEQNVVEWFYEKSGERIGPVSAESICDLLKLGDISYDTLVWNCALGQQWKPIGQAGIILTNVPPPLPPASINNTYAWLLAVAPLIGAGGVVIISRIFDVDVPEIFIILSYIIENTILVIADVVNFPKAVKKPNILLGLIFVPAYLFHRAMVTNKPFVHLACWVVCFLSGLYVSNPAILARDAYWGAGIPTCSSSFAKAHVKSVFQDISLMRLAEVRAIDVRDTSEVSADDAKRTCTATVLGSNANNYNVMYTIELSGKQYFIRVEIVKSPQFGGGPQNIISLLPSGEATSSHERTFW